MKKIIIALFIVIATTSGCKKQEKIKKKEKEEKIEIIEETPKYEDLNNTPIAFYSIKGNSLQKISSINKELVIEDDIGLFQIFPSQEEQIPITNFAEDYFKQWQVYNQNNLKVGFNIKFKINDQEISYNILSPSNTMDKWEHLMTYLYDDYANRNKSFYSHIENNEYNENTLFTAIKLQSSYSCSEITSNIYLTVFTYDTEDDFENNEYRGNSKYTITIITGKEAN
ncbi:MAG: hypothetical protein IKG27_05455 [Bacilli bacterium]|nr:hypothetical protein [Bacilli bacterium]